MANMFAYTVLHILLTQDDIWFVSLDSDISQHKGD